jgi:alkylhydroperoxidase family enzyme
MASTSIPDSVAQLVHTVLNSPAAASSPAIRQAVADHAADLSLERPNLTPIPRNLETYVGKVARHAYKGLDREVEALRAAGYSVDEVFEVTISTAVGAALARMNVALAALEEKSR